MIKTYTPIYFIKKLLIYLIIMIPVSIFIMNLTVARAEDNRTQKFNGNFPTLQVRELWQLCSVTFQGSHPGLPQALRWLVCDCYVDLIRRDLTPETAGKLKPDAQRDLTSNLILECNKILPNNDIET